MSHFIKGNTIAIDTETTGLYPFHGDSPFAFAFYNLDGDRHYFEVEVDPMTRKPIWKGFTSEIDAMGELMEDQKIAKVFHNAKFDVRMFEVALGIKTLGTVHDTMFSAWCCNTLEPKYQLKYLADKYAGIDTADQKDLQKLVNRLRRRAKQAEWNIASESRVKIAIEEGEEDSPGSGEFEKSKAITAADYWLPFTSRKRCLWGDIVDEENSKWCGRYALLDVERTMLLYHFYDKLMDELRVRHTYEEEMDLFPYIYAQETRGMRIDRQRNLLEKRECANKARVAIGEVRKIAGDQFNVNSYKQMSWLLYDRLQLPVKDERRTDKGNPGTAMNALLDFKDNPVILQILRFRSATKAFGYFSRYEQLMLPDGDGWAMHTEIRQLKASTRRFSCVNPNLMQVTSIESSRSYDPIDARGPFGPRKGYAWLCVDYKGQEVRIYADRSQDKKMLEKLAAGAEVHDDVTNAGWGGLDNPAGISECIHVLGLDGSNIGSEQPIKDLWAVWGITDWRKLTDNDRRKMVSEWLATYDWNIVKAQAAVGKKVTKNKAKMVFFAKIYGGTAKAVKDLLHCTMHEAFQFLAALSRTYPRMDEYGEELQEIARENDYSIRTAFDTRLCIRPYKLYQCVNYMVQGTAADMLKKAVIKVGRFLAGSGLDAHVILPLHDELIMEVHRNQLTKSLIRKIQDCMEDTEGRISIPMLTDPSVCFENWHDKHKLNKNLEVI